MIILTDRNLKTDNKNIKKIDINNVKEYDGSQEVVAVVASRVMAICVSKMDFPNLKAVFLTSAGFDGVPIENFREKGVAVCNAGNVYSFPWYNRYIKGS